MAAAAGKPYVSGVERPGKESPFRTRSIEENGTVGATCNPVIVLGVLGSVARKYAHKIPFIVKINHNELLTYPNKFDQILFGTVKEAWNMGAIAVGATVYFGSPK